jgi:hypothetical protein
LAVTAAAREVHRVCFSTMASALGVSYSSMQPAGMWRRYVYDEFVSAP